jgi:hypothetical protein
MIAQKIALGVWLTFLTILWALHPVLFSQSRGVIILAAATMLLAAAGWLSGYQLCVFWGGIVGLGNFTLSLMMTGQLPNLWVGMSAGLTLFALLDASHCFAYLRQCHLEAGLLGLLFSAFLRLCGWSIGAGLSVVALLVALHTPASSSTSAGLLTIVGAVVFLGGFAVFMLYANKVASD